MLLETSRKLNIAVLKEIKLDKTKSALKRLLFLPVSTMVFFMVVASYALYFSYSNSTTWYFVFSGIIVALFSVMFVVSSIKQLSLILKVDYNAPVVRMQKHISQIKIAVFRNLRIAAWLLPFAPFIGVFLLQALFQFDITAQLNYTMITSLGATTILLEIISLLALRALRAKNTNKKWLNWLLQGSGSQVDEALGFLDQIEAFETEENVEE